MATSEGVTAPLISECNRIAEDSLYTAQAHFEVAQGIESFQRWLLLIVPAFVAGICGILTAVGLPTWIGAISAAAGLVSGVSGALGVDKKGDAHLRAANSFTVLRHDAQLAIELRGSRNASQFQLEVEALHKRYNDLTTVVPGTSDAAFEKARKRIKAGRFERDRRP